MKDLAKKLKLLMTSKKKLTDIYSYFLGKLRYKLYYSRFRFLMRDHIQQQVIWRLKYMDQDCYMQGSCKICGCETPALQMANKSCDKPCYPPIMNKKQWRNFKIGKAFHTKEGIWIGLTTDYLKPIYFPNTKPK